MKKFNNLKDYCHWIDWHEGELILRKNSAYDKENNLLAEIDFIKE